MRYLNVEERRQLLGPYHAPQGYYEYIKILPFLETVKSNVQTLVAGQWTEILIVYEVGASGLADGTWIKGIFKFYSVSILDHHINRIGSSSRHQTLPKTTMSAQNTSLTPCYPAKNQPPYNL